MRTVLFVNAQNQGARSIGIGNTSITLSDVWATHNNISATASIDKTQMGLHFDNRFFYSGFNTIAFALVQPSYKFGNASLLLKRLGNEYFSRTHIAFGFAHKIEWVSLGLQVEYIQTYVSEFGSKDNLIFNFGGMARITPTLQMGAIIKNINQAKLADYQDERLPTLMEIGLSYRPYQKLMLNTQIEKNVEKSPLYRFGTEYEISKDFKIRTGITAPSFLAHFGIGYFYHGFEFNYALIYHARLGFGNAITLNYSLGKPKLDSPTKNSLVP